jgi:hypothetical protein
MKCSEAKQPHPLFAGAPGRLGILCAPSGPQGPRRPLGIGRPRGNNQKYGHRMHENTGPRAHAGRRNEPSAAMAAAIKRRASNEVFCDYSRRALHNVVGAASSFLRYTSHFNQPPVLSRSDEPLFAAAAQTARSFSEATTMAPRRVLPPNMHTADSSN